MINLENKYALVILNYNNASLTISTVKKIKQLDGNIKIVVVDNCSTDDSNKQLKLSLEREDNLWLLFNEKNIGYAAGNNVGLRFIDKKLKNVEYAFIMNPDVEVENISVFHNLIYALKNDQTLGVATALTIYNNMIRFPNDCAWKIATKKYLLLGDTILGKIFSLNNKYKKLYLSENEIAYVDIVQGCFFAIKMDVAKKVDFFDEHTFLYGEEEILARKLKKEGYKEGVVINNFIKHNHHEKNKRLQKKKNKLFDMKCFYDSRKYIVEKYSEGSKIYIFCTKLFLNIDYLIKKILISIKYHK